MGTSWHVEAPEPQSAKLELGLLVTGPGNSKQLATGQGNSGYVYAVETQTAIWEFDCLRAGLSKHRQVSANEPQTTVLEFSLVAAA